MTTYKCFQPRCHFTWEGPSEEPLYEHYEEKHPGEAQRGRIMGFA